MPTSLTRAECIDVYNSAGFVLFPCNPDKSPAVRWQGVTRSPENLPRGYGVVLPEDIVVIDFDPRRGPDQISALWHELELPHTRNTFVVETGSGGYHIYYTKPPEVRVRGKVPGYSAIDIKTKGGYVIGAGSTLANGSYLSRHGSPDNISPIPPRLLELITRPNVDTGDREDAVFDDEHTKAIFIERLAQIALADDGDLQRFTLAAFAGDIGLPEGLTIRLMRAYYVGSDADGQLETKVHNAYRYRQNPLGYLHPSTAFNTVQLDPIPEAPPEAQLDALAVAANMQLANGISITRDRQGNEKLDSVLNNVLHFFRLVPHSNLDNPLYKLLRYNRFADRIEFSRVPIWHDPSEPNGLLTDVDVLKIKEYLTVKHLWVPTELVREACIIVAQENAYHPVRDWLLSLRWDGVPRLDMLLPSYAGSPNTAYAREIGKNTLIGAVARVLRPGCQHDHMLILEGAQGTGKTTFVRTLGGEWYADVKIEPGSKDTICRVQGSWIIEMSEMEVLRRADIAALKRFLTQTVDKERLPFARIAVELPRRCAFIGTINPTGNGYLQDTTGNRRFWCVSTGQIQIGRLIADRNQLFAEAVHRFKAGEPWHITDPVINAIAAQEQSSRMVMDSWGDIITEYLDSNELPERLTTELIAWQALQISANRLGRSESMRIHEAMRINGYEQKQTRIDGHRVRIWVETDPTIGLI